MGRICTKCRQLKPVAEFYACRTGKRAGELRTECKGCRKEYINRWRKNKGLVRSREQHLWTNYKIRLTEYERLLEEQGGKCAVCESPSTDGECFCVDHDHSTGEIRGLLCKSCNFGLGFFKDSTERLMKAAEYLRRGRTVGLRVVNG